jgi:hypothetical protein
MAGVQHRGNLSITRDLKSYLETNTKYTNTPEIQRRINEWVEYQEKQEKTYLDRSQSCPIRKLAEYRNKYASIDSAEFKKVVRKNFYNPSVMEEAMCIADSIVYTQPIEMGSITSNQRIRRWLDKMTQIGEESVEGYALETSLDKSDDVFVVKVPRDPNNKDLLHEYFVGLQLNSLRKHIPNFAYVMGGFKCSPPVIDSNKTAVSWCNDSKVNVHYILYENIAPSVTFKEYTKTCSFKNWLDKYLQVLYALHVAREKLDFTHYDLHPGNVLIRSLDTSGLHSIPYQTERGGIEYLSTDGIATIIDYGFSHIKYDGKSFGKHRLMQWGVNPLKSNILHDAYKLLMFSMETMLRFKNLECFNGAVNIFKFFNSLENPITVVNEQRELYYFMPFTPTVEGLGIFDLTKYIRRYIPEHNDIMSDLPKYPIIGCDGLDVCITGADAVSRIGIGNNIEANTVFDFYDLSTRLIARGNLSDFESLKSSFDYTNIMKQAILEYDNLVQSMKDEHKSLVTARMKNIPLPYFFKINWLEPYRDYATGTAALFDKIQRTALSKDAIEYTADKFGEHDLSRSMRSQNEAIKSYLIPVREALTTMKLDMTYIEDLKLREGDEIEKLSKEKPIYKWWWNGLPEIIRLIA